MTDTTPPIPPTPPTSPLNPSTAASAPTSTSPWERKVLENLLAENLIEKRKERRRRTIFQTFWLGLAVLLMLWVWLQLRHISTSASSQQHTAVVNLRGEISDESLASADNINSSLQAAFADENSKAVILRINSPGGSPVQASMINQEMLRLRNLYPKKPLYAVVEETCASGGYYVAVAADKIYVNQASIIGSIGVLIDSFGFVGLMNKLGVERRLYVAGENKAMLDPFLPQTPKHREYAQKMIDEIHQQFIQAVRTGRGQRLKEFPGLFSGLTWSGQSSVRLGLADGFGSVESVARDIVKAEEIIDYTEHEGLVDRVSRRLGASLGSGITHTLLNKAEQLR